ncbi:hypothetical protein EKL99_12260 [Flavobacterium sp. ZB4P23]|uniref:hypothetical protein n=1 Tax=Flavobacterium sp. ZB4P23 TaxID=2497484 RepID=UPI000F8167FE|nr:hypothetical protein [Flavobacterium sp. ZB4P23]RTY81563.1 hypothetical protein EKL99_12260 [Flavobacterium sp. ZB4P23]
MKLVPIFSNGFLSHYLSEFRLSSVTDIRGISIILGSLIEELESGKIESLKEEEIKSRFVSSFFGDVLGFNYGNSNKWQLREEKKSVIDGTKPDAALGYFFADNKKDDVRVVVEIKNALTDLDNAQRRTENHSPVDQAFGYVAKAGGNCKWVIVSNIKETRFYSSLDRSKYQVFFLKDLLNENKLKELLLLFHKDRLINENKQQKSATDRLFEQTEVISNEKDRSIHIIDRIYNSLKRFEGFGFVDPNYIATLAPFNILDEYVWHYSNGNLFTINSEIFDFLTEIKIETVNIYLSDKLKNEISDFNIIEAEFKIEWSFKFLNDCLIREITAVKDYGKIKERNIHTLGFSYQHKFPFKDQEGITTDINLHVGQKCQCISCCYRSLDFNNLLGKLKAAEGNSAYSTSEYAFGNYLLATNNFKTTYTIYKSIERKTKGKQGKSVEYFLTKLNLKLLHNLISDYDLEDKKDIKNDIKSIDLDLVIYDEIEFSVDKDVKKYMVKVKEDVLIYKIQDEIEETLFKIEKLKQLYQEGGHQTSGPNLPHKLLMSYYILYSHINKNNVIYDSFTRYKALTEKVFKAYLISYNLPQWGITQISEFFITEAILNIPAGSLQELLKKHDIIDVEDGCVENLLIKLNNFTSSMYKVGLLNDCYENDLISVQLTYYRFEDRFTEIFSNLFTVFSKLDISKEQFSSNVGSLIKFLKVETVLAWFDIQELGKFILKKGFVFEVKDLMEILKIAITRHKFYNTKYAELIKIVCKSIAEFHPLYKNENVKLIQTAILSSSSDDDSSKDYNNLIYLSKICNDNCKKMLFSLFENYLDENFSRSFYEILIRHSVFDINYKNYFYLYTVKVNKTKNIGTYRYGSMELTDLIFINYILVIYKFNIDFNKSELKLLTDLNDFETWLLNPLVFDYKKFDCIWLRDLKNSIILGRLYGINDIVKAIDEHLENEFDPTLAEIKYKLQ